MPQWADHRPFGGALPSAGQLCNSGCRRKTKQKRHGNKGIDALVFQERSRVALELVCAGVEVAAQSDSGALVSIDSDDIGGVVRGPNGPEAGVWVIAETTELPTTYAKIVVTDDAAATSSPICRKPITASGCAATAWSDSPKVRSEPGRSLNLTAVPRRTTAAAAQYYPAIYWYSMLKIPERRGVRRQRATFPKKHHADRLAEAR